MEPQNILSPEGKAEEKNTINVAGNGEPVAKTDELPVPEAVESVAETSVADTQVQNPCTREQIVERIKELLAIPVEEVKDEIDALKQQYYKLRKNEIEEAHRAYDEMPEENKGEFQIPFDSLEETLKTLLNSFKEKKAVYIEQQEKERQDNLARKQAILDEIKSYTEDPDNIGKYYNDFKERQQEFKEIVNVPASAVSDLWKTFQTYSENFYDLLKIHKELRDYDFKKNLEQKTALCEQAEALAANDDVLDAFKTLQNLHEEWRGIGPVSKEMREDEIDGVSEESLLIKSTSALGHGVLDDITHVVYVKDGVFGYSSNSFIAREIEKVNKEFLSRKQSYILIGPGRWGSSDTALGIPVKWPHISASKLIVETALNNYWIEPSQGTHFFQNLTSFGVGYFTIDQSADGAYYDKAYLDAIPAEYETANIRVVALPHPAVIKINGKKNVGIVMKPETEETRKQE